MHEILPAPDGPTTATEMSVDQLVATWPEIFARDVEALGLGHQREPAVKPADIEHITIDVARLDGGVVDCVAAAHLPARGRWAVLHWQRRATRDGQHIPIVDAWLTGAHLTGAAARLDPALRGRLLGGDL